MDTEENNISAVTSFFSKRAKFMPKISSEEFEATAKLLEDKKEEQDDVVVVQPSKVKSRRKVPAKGKNPEPLQVTVDEKDSDKVKDPPPTEEVSLSGAVKRRLKRLQYQHDRELKRIEAESQKVLSAANIAEVDEIQDDETEDINKINVLTISYLSDLSRVSCRENDKFSTIFPKVADMFHLKVSEFLLCLREHNIKVEDTPKSLAIAENDILECIPYKADSNPQNDADDDRIKIFFQSSDCKGKTEMFVHKLEKMEDIMEKYSNTRDIPISHLVFEFDGERISGSETPEDMDMESGSCIDVKVTTAGTTTGDRNDRKTSNSSNVTATGRAIRSRGPDSCVDLTELAANKTTGNRESENCVDLSDSAADNSNESRESEDCVDLTDSAADKATEDRDCVDLTASTSNDCAMPVAQDAESGNCALVKVVKSAVRKTTARKRGRGRGRGGKTNVGSRKSQPTRTSPRKKSNSTVGNVITLGSDSNDSIVLCE